MNEEYDENHEEKLRRRERLELRKPSQVVTTFSSIPFTVVIEDISHSGALLRTPHLPQIGDRVTLKATDERDRVLFSVKGTVRRLRKIFERSTWAFAMQFDDELTVEQLDSLFD